MAGPAQPCVMMVFNPDNSVVLNGTPVDLGSLKAGLAALHRRTPVPRLCLVAGPGSNPDEVQAALAIIRTSGLTVNMSGVN